MTFRTNHQTITDMKLYATKVMLMQSFLYLILGGFTVGVISVALSGDSSNIREQREAVRTLTMPPSTQIK